jgi:hypothetical protein
MFRPSWALVVGGVLFATSARAGDYTFDLPELLGSRMGERLVSVDLGGAFSLITSARLRVEGTHAPGLAADLNFPGATPYPADVTAYSPATPFGNSGILGGLLPTGSFVMDKEFRRVRPDAPPELASWLDGTAEFYFSVHPAAILGTMYVIANPSATIDAATLFVTGERADPVATSGADFDGDGDRDGADFLVWQRGAGTVAGAARSHGDADLDGDVDAVDLSAWRMTFGASPALISVPEPTASVPVILAAAVWARRSLLGRRR